MVTMVAQLQIRYGIAGIASQMNLCSLCLMCINLYIPQHRIMDVGS